MTKDFYEKNYKTFIPIIEKCECEDFSFCNNNLCPIFDACEYYYTGDDKKFDEEEE